jgi:hypothetical protein
MNLKECIKDEFEGMKYPIRNIMEISPQLSDGSETVFNGDEKTYKAVNIVRELNGHLDNAPNNGFPYDNKDEIIEDLYFALREEGVIE